MAHVKIEAWRQAYAGILDAAVLGGLDLKKETERWQDRLERNQPGEPLWVAEDGSQVLGFIVVGPNRFPEVPCDSELHAIYVDPTVQRRGVGRALLNAGVEWLLAQGYESMAVFVFRDNAIGTEFYRSLGAEFYNSGEYEVAGKKYPDESYVWHSLQVLSQRLR